MDVLSFFDVIFAMIQLTMTVLSILVMNILLNNELIVNFQTFGRKFECEGLCFIRLMYEGLIFWHDSFMCVYNYLVANNCLRPKSLKLRF